jgi:hypothetical protein
MVLVGTIVFVPSEPRCAMQDERSQGMAGPSPDDGAPEPSRQILVVPRTPGPLRPLDRSGPGQGDELDEIIEEVFGPTTDEGPGIFDVVLVAGGLALVAWSWISGGAGPWFAIGIQ